MHYLFEIVAKTCKSDHWEHFLCYPHDRLKIQRILDKVHFELCSNLEFFAVVVQTERLRSEAMQMLWSPFNKSTDYIHIPQAHLVLKLFAHLLDSMKQQN